MSELVQADEAPGVSSSFFFFEKLACQNVYNSFTVRSTIIYDLGLEPANALQTVWQINVSASAIKIYPLSYQVIFCYWQAKTKKPQRHSYAYAFDIVAFL